MNWLTSAISTGIFCIEIGDFQAEIEVAEKEASCEIKLGILASTELFESFKVDFELETYP